MSFELELNPGNVKTAMKAADAPSRDLWYVPVGKLKVIDGFNVRTHGDDYDAHVAAIGESILANGFRPNKALGVFISGDDICIYDGHCRFAAIAYANERGAAIESVPCISAPRGTTLEDLTVELHVANSGKPLAPIELAQVIKRLIGYGSDEAAIAKRLSISKTYVDQLLTLLESPAPIRQMVQEGVMSASTAVGIVKQSGGGEAAVGAAEAAVDVAHAQGSDRVTKRHVAPASPLSKRAKKLSDRTAAMILKLNDLGLADTELGQRMSSETLDEFLVLVSELDAFREEGAQ